MIGVSTHLFGSTDGYHTLTKSDDISAADDHALSIFGFGSPKSQAEIDQLPRHPSVAGRFLPSGRFAITRLFPGQPDVAGRETVERRSIIFTAQDWKSVVRCNLELLVQSEHAFHREAFTNTSAHAIEITDSEDLLPVAGELERRLYDILLSTPRKNACALIPDNDQNRRGLLKLLQLMSNTEASQLSWGLGLFAATPGVRIATASTSVAAGPNARWASLVGNLAYPEKVATLGLHQDTHAAMHQTGFNNPSRSSDDKLKKFALKYWPWTFATLAILILIVSLIYSLRANKPSAPPATSAVAPPATSDVAPLGTPAVVPTATPATPAVVPTANTIDVLDATNEPVNTLRTEIELWNKVKVLRSSIQQEPEASIPDIQTWIESSLKQLESLKKFQDEITTQFKDLNYKDTYFSKINTKNPPTLLADQAKQICIAGILILAQCDIMKSKFALSQQLDKYKAGKPNFLNREKNSKKFDNLLEKIKMPPSIDTLIKSTSLPEGSPAESIYDWFYPKLQELFNTNFPESPPFPSP